MRLILNKNFELKIKHERTVIHYFSKKNLNFNQLSKKFLIINFKSYFKYSCLKMF